MINIKYIDDLCDAKLINKKIVCHEDKYGTMWTNFYFKGELTDYLISNKGDLYSFKSRSIVNKRYLYETATSKKYFGKGSTTRES